MYQSWCFLFQVTESPSEPAKMDNGKFIGSYNPSAEKADVDLTSGPETKDSDLFSWMFSLSNLSIIFLPSNYLLHVAKNNNNNKNSPGFIWLMLPELMTRGKRLSFRILTLKSPHKGIALSQLGSPAWISHMDKRWKILLDSHSLKVNAHHNT